MLEVSANKIALLVADGTSVTAVISEYERRFPAGLVIHVGYSAPAALPLTSTVPISLFPLINIRKIIAELKDAGVNGIAYAGDLGLLRVDRDHRLHGRVAEYEDHQLSKCLENEELNIEATLERLGELLEEAELQRIHLSMVIPHLEINGGWLVEPKNPLRRALFEKRIWTLTERIHLGQFANATSARTTFVFDGTRLISPVEQSTDKVLASIKNIAVPNDDFRSFAKISTTESSVDISAPTVGKTTFEAAKAAKVSLAILDADCGVFAQQVRTIEFCEKHEISVYGFKRQFLARTRQKI